MRSLQYSLMVDVDDCDLMKWRLVCEGCGAELDTSHLAEYALTLVKVRGFAELMATEPEAANQLAEQLHKMMSQAQTSGRPLVLDADVNVQQVVPDRTIERLSAEHARICPRTR